MNPARSSDRSLQDAQDTGADDAEMMLADVSPAAAVVFLVWKKAMFENVGFFSFLLSLQPPCIEVFLVAIPGGRPSPLVDADFVANQKSE